MGASVNKRSDFGTQGTNSGTRRGLVGWWLNLTAPPVPSHALTINERERLRKAELTSFSILTVFLFLLALVSNSLAKPSTAQAVIIMAIGLVIATILNRLDKTRTAAYLVPGLLMTLIGLSIVGSDGLDLIIIPGFDLLVIPIFLVSLTGNRNAPWVFALVATAFIVGDFSLQHHTLINVDAPGIGRADNFDGVAYLTSFVGLWGAINRHVALALFAGFFGWLGARSVDNAIARADRAEEIAALERAAADQSRQLEIGIQQLRDTHTRLANGDFSARAPLDQRNVLWEISGSLNNLISRFQRAAQADYQLKRTEEEISRIVAAIDDARMGRQPIWPAPTGTPADILLERITGGQRPGPTPSMMTSTQAGPPSHYLPPQTHTRNLPPQGPNPQAPLPPFSPSAPGMQPGAPLGARRNQAGRAPDTGGRNRNAPEGAGGSTGLRNPFGGTDMDAPMGRMEFDPSSPDADAWPDVSGSLGSDRLPPSPFPQQGAPNGPQPWGDAPGGRDGQSGAQGDNPWYLPPNGQDW